MALYKDYIGLGIAGNFALHLDQAGEAEDFKDVITADEAAPKGMFPFYLPSPSKKASKQLQTYPLSSTTIKLPNLEENVQAEPEVAIICEFSYEDGKLAHIKPTHFVAYNDCSIRRAGAKKISEKKNWGEASKGIGELHIPIDRYTAGGVKDSYSIVSFLKRNGEVHQYGEDVEINGYSYLYEQLLEWIKNQINTQEDFGPLEPILEYIQECEYPQKAIISIGATRYTEFGETNFLKPNDEIFVVLYHKDRDDFESVKQCVEMGLFKPSMSVLHQKVVV
ncbi:MAG: hypothetical protein GXO11_08310 [Epsilonproteobacteria bacterium]|nr:hypothetical protein [Campylobacterota bacterium]